MTSQLVKSLSGNKHFLTFFFMLLVMSCASHAEKENQEEVSKNYEGMLLTR